VQQWYNLAKFSADDVTVKAVTRQGFEFPWQAER